MDSVGFKPREAGMNPEYQLKTHKLQRAHKALGYPHFRWLPQANIEQDTANKNLQNLIKIIDVQAVFLVSFQSVEWL